MTKDLEFSYRDEFNRAPLGQKICFILESNIDISPMIIDGDWGTGKTEFCHKLIKLIRNNDRYGVIYIDAFKADHTNEPLLTILAEVINLIPNDEKDSFIRKAIPAARFGIKTLGKAAVAHILRQDYMDVANDFDKDISKVTDKIIDSSVESLLNDHIEAEKSLKGLQTALERIGEEKPLILFIDELDRCRPDFAINMLEVIKHTFDVKGVKFVFITNTEQLKHSIAKFYGNPIGTQRYLDKFIKYSISLPKTINTSNRSKINASLEYYRSLIYKNEFSECIALRDNEIIKMLRQIITVNNLSLRDIEKIVRSLGIYILLNPNNFISTNEYTRGRNILSMLGIIIFSLYHSEAKKISMNDIDINAISKILGVTMDISYTNDENKYDEYYEKLNDERLCRYICYWLNLSSLTPVQSFTLSVDNENYKEYNDSIHYYFSGPINYRSGTTYSKYCSEAINILSLYEV